MSTPAEDAPGTLLLGADVGATHARVRVFAAPRPGGPPAQEPGPTLGSADGPGYNRNSSGPDALQALAATVERALEQARARAPGPPAARVVAVLGIAGAGPAHHHQIQEAVRDVLRRRLRPAPAREDLVVVDDQVTAFAAGSTDGDGLLLLAGTGSAAVRYRGFRAVVRSDGMGWLLGDTGSAVWIGREVLQAVAADLDSRGPRTALTPVVLEQLGIRPPRGRAMRVVHDQGDGDVRQAMIAAVHELTPAQWGGLAPSAEGCADDPVAGAILADAARELVAKVDAVLEREAAVQEIVLTGSVISRNETVSQRVRQELTARGLRIRPEAAPLEGALRLAREM